MFDFNISNLTPEKIALMSSGIMISVIIILVLFKQKNHYPYFACETLLTRAELKFFSVLSAVTKNKYGISCKVRLADIINCSEQNWHRGYGPKISSKHIDFVLFDIKTSDIILCIELDDKSHNRPDRIKRDHFVNKALKVSNVPLLRVPVSKGYDMAALEKNIVLSLQ